MKSFTTVFALLWSCNIGIATAAQCALNLVYGFQYSCGIQGWARQPSVLQTFPSLPTVEDCAIKCLGGSECKSFRYIEAQSLCYLYGKHLGQMDFDDRNFNQGVYYERACWSFNCNTISACSASRDCEKQSTGFYGPKYEQFACGYGLSAKPYDFTYDVTHYNSSYSTCDALHECAKVQNFGSFDLGWEIASKSWVCTTYHDEGRYLTSRHAQRVRPTTFTVRNASVGAAYGFWFYHIYED